MCLKFHYHFFFVLICFSTLVTKIFVVTCRIQIHLKNKEKRAFIILTFYKFHLTPTTFINIPQLLFKIYKFNAICFFYWYFTLTKTTFSYIIHTFFMIIMFARQSNKVILIWMTMRITTTCQWLRFELITLFYMYLLHLLNLFTHYTMDRMGKLWWRIFVQFLLFILVSLFSVL